MQHEIRKPLPFREIQPVPDFTKPIKLSEDMQQVLSLLTAFNAAQRVLLKASPSGILYVSPPLLKDIINITANQASYNWQGSNIKCSEILVTAHPDNTGRVWVNNDEAAAVNTGEPLDAGDSFNFGLMNLINLHIHIETDTEKAIVAYSI